MKTTIKKLHAEWAAIVLPKDASKVQRQECERAFYSGAYALFKLTIAEIAAKSDDEAEKQMEAVQHELEDYFTLMATIPGTGGTERQ